MIFCPISRAHFRDRKPFENVCTTRSLPCKCTDLDRWKVRRPQRSKVTSCSKYFCCLLTLFSLLDTFFKPLESCEASAVSLPSVTKFQDLKPLSKPKTFSRGDIRWLRFFQRDFSSQVLLKPLRALFKPAFLFVLSLLIWSNLHVVSVQSLSSSSFRINQATSDFCVPFVQRPCTSNFTEQ